MQEVVGTVMRSVLSGLDINRNEGMKMKNIPKWLLIFTLPGTLFMVLLTKPDSDNPFTYSQLSLTFLALIFILGLIVTVVIDVYTRLSKLEKTLAKYEEHK